MEILSPLEGLDEGDWISPRISFSQDFQLPGRCSPKMQFKDSPEEEFSFLFRDAANSNLPADDSMLSADELFSDGKVRPLRGDAGVLADNAFLAEDTVGFGRSIEENPRCFSMTIESCRGEARGSRAYMSLNNSRCSSPSRTMSMPRTTPTSPQSSSHLPPSSTSSTLEMPEMLSGQMLSSSSVRPAGMPSSMTPSSLTSMSSSVCVSSTASSSKYSSKLKDFFKLKKGNTAKDAATPSLPFSSTSAEITRESSQTSGTTSCRLPSKSFWPFSRSNSAGESKTAPAVLPPPRRSNSAGEGKTTSSSLLPINGPPSKQLAQSTHKNSPSVASTNVQAKGLAFSADTASSVSSIAKKGLPPLPNSIAKKANSFFVPAHCGADSVALSPQSAPVPVCTASHRSIDSMPSIVSSEAEPSHTPPACARETSIPPEERTPNGNIQCVADSIPVATRKGRCTTAASPGRPMRRGAHGNAARNFARSSPGRRGAWNSPGRGNGGRVSIRNLERGSISTKGHVRPKDMLSRDGASVRISPVLNVAVPSLRGTKAASKSRIFNLGNLFSKKERVASMRAYTVPPPPDNQSLV